MMRRIERQVLIKRRGIIRRGVGLFTSSIAEQYKQALSMIYSTPIDNIIDRIRDSVRVDPIRRTFDAYYPMAAEIGVLWRNELVKQKAEGDVIYQAAFQRKLLERSRSTVVGKRIDDITSTTEDHIITSVRNSLEKGFAEGLGTDKMRQLIIDNVIAQGEEMIPQRAQLIAQTEMVTASNMAAMEGAHSAADGTTLEIRKFWSTSGLPNVRDSHLEAEADSINNNGYAEDEPFSNGILYPGDPEGPPEEICGCRCSVLIELV